MTTKKTATEKLSDLEIGSWAGALAQAIYEGRCDMEAAARVLALALDGSVENGDRDLIEYLHTLWSEAIKE